MEDRSGRSADFRSEEQTGVRDRLHLAVDRIAARNYLAAARSLQELETTAAQTGRNELARILALLQHLCVTCRLCLDEGAYHNQAQQMARQQESDLQGELIAIIELIFAAQKRADFLLFGGERDETDSPPVGGASAAGEESRTTSIFTSLWARVQQLFKTDQILAEVEKTGIVPEVRRPSRPIFPPDPPRPIEIDADRWPDPANSKEQGQAPFETGTVQLESERSATGNPPHLTVYTLGLFRAFINDRQIDDWHGNKSKSIFKYLVIYRKRPVPVEVLMDLFWRGDEPESARRNLYQAIYLLRQALQEGDPDFPFIISTNGYYDLNPDLEVWLDSDVLADHFTAGQQLEERGQLLQAIHEYEKGEILYEGDFLLEDIYEDWPAALRETLKNSYLDLLNRLSRYYFDQENWAMSITYAQKILHIEDWYENTHRLLMHAYCRQGQRHLALRQFHRCEEALMSNLGVNPSPETVDLYQKIFKNLLHYSVG